MKNILLLVHPDEGQESRLQCALDVVRAVDGHLTCLDIVAPLVIYDGFVEAYAQGALLEDAAAAEQDNRNRLEPRLKVEGVPYSWVSASGFVPDCIAEQARLNDLVVVGAHAVRGEARRSDVADVIVRSVRRPVLAVPRGTKRVDLCGTALVGWDGSDAAAAALRAAIPLLKLSTEVVIVTVGDNRCDPTEAAEYCARHGVSAEVLAAPKAGSTSATLLARAKDRGAGWIAMGAYGHSPLREAIFGGVTREMLEHSPLPLLIAS
jgi:nucleotide-binding universal stress UspA family protein